MSKSEDLLVQVARLYYEYDLTQTEIGRKLNTSRSTVSRLLKEARESGVVRVIINYPWKRDTETEKALLKRFKLRDVRVLKGMERTYDEVLQGMGTLAAQYLDEFIRDDIVLGVAYGRSIAAMLEQLVPSRYVAMTVVQIIGALGLDNPSLDGPDLVRRFANMYSAKYRYLYTPMILESKQTRDLLIEEPKVKETLSVGRHADAVVIGIGRPHHTEESGLMWTGYFNKQNLAYLRDQGAIGHMCAQHFDANGQLLDVDVNHRVISIGIDALQQIETVIAIAGSVQKARAILGALRGEYIDVLITDDLAAKHILDLS